MTSLKPSTLRVLRALHAAGDRGATTDSPLEQVNCAVHTAGPRRANDRPQATKG